MDAHPYFVDGFQHTDQSFDAAWAARDFHGSTFDYLRFCAENGIARRIDDGELDEVWIYAGPIGGMFESVMAGKGAYWINGPAQPVPSERAFAIMGWNFERGVGEAIHSFGHRAEGNMVHIYNRWQPDQADNWSKFALLDKDAAGQGGVGNVHFPVNGQSDYDYANPRFVASNADDWYNYPNFTGATRTFNFREWSPNGMDPQREYLNWWYAHMPHFPGRGADGYLNNWWRYIVDIDQFKSWDGNLSATDGIPAVRTVAPAAGGRVSGVVTVRAEAWADGALGRVDLYVDGVYYASDTIGPYTFSWDTAGLSGSHTLTTKAYELQNGTEAVSAPIVVDLGPIRVDSYTRSGSGVTVRFSSVIDSNALTLYDAAAAGFGAADVMLVGDAVGPVGGSLVVSPDRRSITFLKTGDVLSPDTYRLTLRSAVDGLKDDAGGLLDGDGDGAPGGDSVVTFAVPALGGRVVGLPDFVRGPGQPVDVPATAAGLPLRLSDGTGVTALDLTLRYDPTLLDISGATAAADLPAGATVTTTVVAPGALTLHFRSPIPLKPGAVTLATLAARVPASAAYRARHVLDLTAVSLNGGALAVADDDALHVVAYFGDTTGNAGYSAADAQRISRVIVGLDSGFAAFPLVDPVVLSDVTGNGALSSTDATRVLQEAVGQDRPEIPPLPGSTTAAVTAPGLPLGNASDARKRELLGGQDGDGAADSPPIPAGSAAALQVAATFDVSPPLAEMPARSRSFTGPRFICKRATVARPTEVKPWMAAVSATTRKCSSQ